MVVCPICNKLNWTEELFIEDSSKIVRCNKCELIFVNSQPIYEDLKQENIEINIGSQVSFSKGIKDYVNFEFAHISKAKIWLKIICNYKKKGKILDVGCSTGYFLKVLNKQGYKTFGVEVSRIACEYGKENFGLNIFCGDINSANFGEKEFDIITMFNVLSHLRDPRNVFEEASRILKEDGFLVIETGNKGEFTSRGQITIWGDIWGPKEHFFHYSRKALRKILIKNGFKILEINIYPVILSSLLRAINTKLQKFILKNNPVKKEVTASFGSNNFFIKAYSILDVILRYKISKLLRWLHVDSTMILVCKKSRF